MVDGIVERLIAEVQKNLPLFDKTKSIHKDANKKRDIWDAIRLVFQQSWNVQRVTAAQRCTECSSV